MTTNKHSPASIALQSYLDDLTHQPSAVEQKLMNAKRLLVEANPIEQLLDIEGLQSKSVKGINTVKMDEQALTEQLPNVELSPELHPKAKKISTKDASVDKEISTNADTSYKQEIRDASESLKVTLPARFQVLLCDVSGVTIALPLIELGGIHKIDKLSMNAKKPSWFKGLLIKGDMQLNCIDAATWLIPEKDVPEKDVPEKDAPESYEQEQQYKFAVQLGKSNYALCCNSISHTIELVKEDVKWRGEAQKHPWLAGLLKEKMCALIDGAKMVQEVLT